MALTLNQFLLLVITITVVVAVIFLAFFLAQVRRTAREGEETLIEIKSLVRNLEETSRKANKNLDAFNDILEASKKAVISLSEISWVLLSAKAIKPSSKYWPLLLPLLRVGWRQLKKRKEGKNVK
ncbi:MAG: hypothetical protein IBX60_01990 [Candidatus Aminicenantes bacterium]|nr:hypothetical protein [Candidatus Aminicenantes bacterium]